MGKKEPAEKLFSCVKIKSNLAFLEEGWPWSVLVGMDTHVKEGQLYVQHQKFGKVSPSMLGLTSINNYVNTAVALTKMT